MADKIMSGSTSTIMSTPGSLKNILSHSAYETLGILKTMLKTIPQDERMALVYAKYYWQTEILIKVMEKSEQYTDDGTAKATISAFEEMEFPEQILSKEILNAISKLEEMTYPKQMLSMEILNAISKM